MPEIITKANACDHRSTDPLRVDKCDVCSGQFPKGTPFEVYGCAIHGECSFEHRRRKTKSCSACLDRESVAFGVLPIIEAPKPSKLTPNQPKADPAKCQHRSPQHHVFVDRKGEPWTATVTIVCRDCREPFTINGQPAAVLPLSRPAHRPDSSPPSQSAHERSS